MTATTQPSLCDSCKAWENCEPIFRNEVMCGEHGCGRHAPITRADLAARDAEIADLKRGGCVVPEDHLTEEEREECQSRMFLGDACDLAFAYGKSRTTQPIDASRVVVDREDFQREDRYVVLKRSDLERHATPAQLRELQRICAMVFAGRKNDGKRLNSYVVVADDWPEYEETWAKIEARVLGKSIPDPQEHGNGMVSVDREEWETLQEIASRWLPPFGVPYNMEAQALFDRLHALREQAKGVER